jgi:L-threonylcarbamoyladenylate synthase
MQALIDTDVDLAAQLLIDGQCVAIPTETVYGLAANALDKNAAAQIFKIKNRPEFDPLIVHVDSMFAGMKWVKEFPEKAELLARRFWPGPLTLVLPKKKEIPYEVTAGLETVGLRVPQHDLTIQLLEMLDFPLAAPSANPFGYVSPTSADHVFDQLRDKIPYILDGGESQIGIESTIVGFENGIPVIYRRGAITEEMIMEVCGEVRAQTHSTTNPKAPGMLTSHYSPNADVEIITRSIRSIRENEGYIAWRELPKGMEVKNKFILSANGDLYEAARRLYAGLRLLDRKGLVRIFIELVPESGIGASINDRIRRSAAEK